MTDLTDLMDFPEPHGYHDHDGEQVPFYYTSSRIQKPGKELEDIPFEILCVVCGFTPNPRECNVPALRLNPFLGSSRKS